MISLVSVLDLKRWWANRSREWYAGNDFSSSDTSIDSVYTFAPTAVQTTELEGIFDFVIRAEEVGVSIAEKSV